MPRYDTEETHNLLCKGNESLSGYRKKAVKDVTTMNTILYNSKVGVVAEIVFLPQTLHPVQESDLIKYTWDPKKKMFIHIFSFSSHLHFFFKIYFSDV